MSDDVRQGGFTQAGGTVDNCVVQRFLAKLGSGCQLPVGAYARCLDELMLMTVFICSLDGEKAFRAKLEGLALDPLQMASDAYLAVVERGAGPLLEVEWSELT